VTIYTQVRKYYWPQVTNIKLLNPSLTLFSGRKEIYHEDFVGIYYFMSNGFNNQLFSHLQCFKYDYDTKADFQHLKTFNWMPIPAKADVDRLNIERIKNAVNSQMAAKGFRKTRDNPDFLIASHVGQKQKVRVADWGYGYGPYGGYWGPRGVDVYKYEEGPLILDFVDTKSKKLIWRGSAKAQISANMTPEKREKLIAEAVQKILEKFPPPPSK